MTTYTCPRCNGSGRLTVFSNVLGGTCFRCDGKGALRTKPASPTPKWAVFGQHRETGAWVRLYNVTAKTKDGAIERARDTYASASSDWKDTYTLAQARAIKWSDMTDLSAVSWDEATRDPTTAAECLEVVRNGRLS